VKDESSTIRVLKSGPPMRKTKGTTDQEIDSRTGRAVGRDELSVRAMDIWFKHLEDVAHQEEVLRYGFDPYADPGDDVFGYEDFDDPQYSEY